MSAIKQVVSSPAIRGEYLKIDAGMQEALAAAIAERTGAVDPGADIGPQILAGAATAATRVAKGRWFRADPPEPLLPVIELALRQLAAPPPACSPRSATQFPMIRSLREPSQEVLRGLGGHERRAVIATER